MLCEWNNYYRYDTKNVFKITSINISGYEQFRLTITQYVFSNKLLYYNDSYQDSIILDITDISNFIKKIRDWINDKEYFTLDEIKKVNLKFFSKEKKTYVKNFINMSDNLFNKN